MFREQPVNDKGIDAHIELLRDSQATGRLIALQIRSGSSRFREETDAGFVHREDISHLNYWLNHSLPVVLVLCDTNSDRCYWVRITRDVAHITSDRGWRVLVPKNQVLDSNCAPILTAIAEDRPDLHDLLSHPAKLAELARYSRARCISRWEAVGLSEQEAACLADDPSIGMPGDWFDKCAGKLVVVLTGDIGAGKSLAAERLFQGAVRKAQNDSGSPIPVYLTEGDLRAAVGRLRASVEEAARPLGNPGLKGAVIVLDGLDEVGSDALVSLRDEARAIADTWPSTRVIMTSRPLPEVEQAAEKVRVPELTDDEVASLITWCTGDETSSYSFNILPPSVRKAVHYPLFAVLYGMFLRRRQAASPRSTGEMISHVVERALARATSGIRTSATHLIRLAVLNTDRGGAVPSSEIGTTIEVQSLLDTRLVVLRSGLLSFALPVFAEWFAAQGLGTAGVSISAIIGDPRRLDRWRYPLAVFAATGNHDAVSSVLTPLAEIRPAFAAEVIAEGIAKRGLSSEGAMPTADECGRRLREAMGAWVKGLGPLAQLVAPLRRDGTLQSVGVATNAQSLDVAWYSGGDKEDVHQLELGPHLPSRDYPSIRWASICEQSAWAWQWTHEELVANLSSALKKRALPIDCETFVKEAAWRMALALMDMGSLRDTPIPIWQLQRKIAEIENSNRRIRKESPEPIESITVVLGLGRSIYEPEPLVSHLDDLVRRGEDHLRPPWPGSDLSIENRSAPWVWSPYSASALLSRTRAVYSGAMEIYTQLVDTWFERFATHLHTYALMPARLGGHT